jgi:DNA (cytosine-5)-methyltransferase 1
MKQKNKQLHLELLATTRQEGLPSVSLFSGAGGMDLGLEFAGNKQIRFCAWVEKDDDCRRTLKLNHPHAEGKIFGDIRAIKPRQLMGAAGLDVGEAFVLAGGPPCQAFSTAGLRQSVHEQRGQVVDHYFDLLRVIRPRFFVFENVRGLLSVAIKHRPYRERIESERQDREADLDEEYRLGSVFQQFVLPRFNRLGYEVVYGLVNAADYGTAQVRHRLLFLGSRDREFGAGRFRKETGRLMTPLDLLPPTHHKFAPYEPICSWRTLKDAIAHLGSPSRDQCITYSAERASVWKRIPPGRNWTFIRDNPKLFPEGLETLMGGGFTAGGGKVGFWRRLSWDKPTPTLPTQPQHLATGLCHPDQERPLSIPEYAALQDFPPHYSFSGSKSSIYSQIGNAVPARLSKAIGEALLSIAGLYRWSDVSDEERSIKAYGGTLRAS